MSLAAQGLTYAYVPGRPVLARVSLAVEPGEILFLLGPNGSGKTTLLECLGGLRLPQEGTVLLDGTPVPQLSPKDRAKKIAYVPQFSEAVFAFTVEDLVLFGRAPHLGPLSRPERVDREKARKALALVGLEGLATRPIHTLSGGERRLALIARALAQEAPYLLLDEPDAHLDPANQHRVLSLVRALAREGLGILATTHNPNAALVYGGRVLLLRAGEVLGQGDPAAVLTPEALAQAYGIPFRIVGDGAGPKAVLPRLDENLT